MQDSRESQRRGEPDDAHDARFRTRSAGLSASDAALVAEETEVMPIQRALTSGAVILERLPDGRAWVLRDGVMAELVRALCSA
ncbi:MAG TPA: hypothetical protein EYQ27_22165 [Gemmatimonadetes bacterium]|nr:hypothetical protein [Gemmatimonadota bacterium]